jgi:enediyne biosynthesis protein CalE5
MSSTLNPTEFRTGQREQWNVAASGWKKWAPHLDRAAGPVRERLVDLAGVKAGDRVLDVAAGYGEPALTAARRVGAEGHVVATDISREMLAYGRERAAEAGLDNIEFIEADASSLDFPAQSFDAALSSWGIIFDPEGEATAARVRGFLKPGARMAISSWGPPDRVPMLGVPALTVMEVLQIPPPPPGTPGPLSRPTSAALGGLLEGGGFSDVEVIEDTVVTDLASPEEFTTFVREIAPPISAMMRDRTAEEQAEAWDAITVAISVLADDSGRIRLENQTLLAVGRA